MKILLLTSVYRDDALGKKDESTAIVNYFARDWVKQGHEVLVIHNAHQYPRIVHALPKGVKRRLGAVLGFPIHDWEVICTKRYTDQGVVVRRLPMLKIVPHKGHSAGSVSRQVARIRAAAAEEQFTPEVIIGHWASPQMEIIAQLKDVYGCRTAVVLHGMGYIKRPDYPVREYLGKIDRLGTRSRAQAEKVQKLLDLPEAPFICYSGVPDDFLEQYAFDPAKFAEKPKTWRFIYAGRLVKYKAIDRTLRALARLEGVDYTFDVIGEGGEKERLIALADELGITGKVTFHGKIPREEVLRYMRDAHAFIMVSKGEIFGLVYLEAMASTCIAVGSAGEGIDGVIEDGENGLLCAPQDEDALLAKLQWLTAQPESVLSGLARKGYETAQAFADSKVAERYLRDVTR